jgi:predicted DNA-binding protein (MmcQ/YjbR family)
MRSRLQAMATEGDQSTKLSMEKSFTIPIEGIQDLSSVCLSRAAMNKRNYEKALRKIRSICLALPEGKEVMAWGHPTFRAGKKMFAGFGEHDDELSLGMSVGYDRQDELLRDARFFPTPYAARLGWVSLRIDDKTDWAEVASLLQEAYQQVALVRMLKALDQK